MTIVALVHLVSLAAVLTGFVVSPGHSVVGYGWFVLLIAHAASGVVLAASVLA